MKFEPHGDTTRHRVAESILREGPSTAGELAQRLELTPAGVRRHLQALSDDGLVVSRERRAEGRGRPSHEYALTDAGRTHFGQSYDKLAVHALEFLERQGGPEAVEAFAQERARRLEQRFSAIAEAQPELSPVEALTRALEEDGFVATTSPAATGAQVCQHHCPVAHVAERFPQLCRAETDTFQRLMGQHVQRLASIAHGDVVCTTHIPHPINGGRDD